MMNYQQLLSEQAAEMGMTAPAVVLETTGNASTDGRQVYVNPNWMARIEADSGEGGVRFVLAHELGHCADGMSQGHGGELRADQFAARSISRTGFGFDTIEVVGKHLNQEATSSHPASPQRIGQAKEHMAAEQAATAQQQRGEQVANVQQNRGKIVRRFGERTPVRRKADRNRNTREHAL